MSILDTLTERRVTRLVTTSIDKPYKYDNGITKGWAVDVHAFTEDGTGPFVITEKYRLKRDAVACQERHIDGSNPTWEMTVSTDERGKAVLWTERYGQRFKG